MTLAIYAALACFNLLLWGRSLLMIQRSRYYNCCLPFGTSCSFAVAGPVELLCPEETAKNEWKV